MYRYAHNKSTYSPQKSQKCSSSLLKLVTFSFLVQFNELGIDFGGLESENVSVPVSSPTAITSSAVTTTEQLVTEPSANEISSLLSYDTEVQRYETTHGSYMYYAM